MNTTSKLEVPSLTRTQYTIQARQLESTSRATREAPRYQARTYPTAIPPGPPVNPALLVERSW